MLAPDPADRLHNQHPPPPASYRSRQPFIDKFRGSKLHAETQPKALFDWMDGNGWTYRPGGKGPRLAYQNRLESGLLEHAEHRISTPGGGERLTTQVRITRQGHGPPGRDFQPARVAPGARPRGRA
jgi:hypothetical protein